MQVNKIDFNDKDVTVQKYLAELKLFIYENFPEDAAAYCFGLWKKYGFFLYFKRPRKRVLGNYCIREGYHQITVNVNLPPKKMMITYLHEVAHLIVREKYKRRIQPHGKEWKTVFGQVLQPVLTEPIFTAEELSLILPWSKNPPATSGTQPEIEKILGGFFDEEQDHLADGMVTVSSLNSGEVFQYQDKVFVVEKKLRTWYLCHLQGTRKKYRIRGSLAVVPVTPTAEL